MSTTTCIEACAKSARACLATASQHCLVKGGRHVQAERFRLMLDCAEVCQTAANFMARGSAVHAAICGACAEVCDHCARSCAEFDDEHMSRCADLCVRCAAECRDMAMAGAR